MRVARRCGGDAPLAIQKEVLDVVSEFPGARRDVGPAQVEALLRIDARLEPVIAQLTQQYTTNYQKSTGVESRLWHSVFDLVKAFAAAYQAGAEVGLPAGRTTSAGARCCHGCWCASRLQGHRRQVPAVPLRHWIPAQWREFHELYEFARMRGWQSEQLVLGAGSFAHTGVSRREPVPEDAAADAARLRQLHAGPGRVGRPPARGLGAVARRSRRRPAPAPGFFVDLTGTQGLRRQDGTHTGGRVMYLDASPGLRADRRADALAPGEG